MFSTLSDIYVIQEGYVGMGGVRHPPLLMQITKMYMAYDWQDKPAIIIEGLDSIGFKSKSTYNPNNEYYRKATEQEIILYWPRNEKKAPSPTRGE